MFATWKKSQSALATMFSLALPGACCCPRTIADLEVTFEKDVPAVYAAGPHSHLKWLLDTGSGTTVLDEDAAEGLSLTPTSHRFNIVDAAGNRDEDIPVEILDELLLIQTKGRKPYRLQNLAVIRVAGLRDRFGFDAILGFQPFEDRVLQLDLGRPQVRVLARSPSGPGVQSLPLTLHQGAPVTEIMTSTGHRFAAQIDTGSNSWFSLTPSDRKPMPLKETGVRVESSTLMGESRSRQFRFDGYFELGPVIIANPPITESTKVDRSLMGAAALPYFRITLDPRRSRAAIDLPNLPWSYFGIPPRRIGIAIATISPKNSSPPR